MRLRTGTIFGMLVALSVLFVARTWGSEPEEPTLAARARRVAEDKAVFHWQWLSDHDLLFLRYRTVQEVEQFSLFRRNVQTGKETLIARMPPTMSAPSLAVAPDGRHLLWEQVDGTVGGREEYWFASVLATGDGKPLQQSPLHLWNPPLLWLSDHEWVEMVADGTPQANWRAIVHDIQKRGSNRRVSLAVLGQFQRETPLMVTQDGRLLAKRTRRRTTCNGSPTAARSVSPAAAHCTRWTFPDSSFAFPLSSLLVTAREKRASG